MCGPGVHQGPLSSGATRCHAHVSRLLVRTVRSVAQYGDVITSSLPATTSTPIAVLGALFLPCPLSTTPVPLAPTRPAPPSPNTLHAHHPPVFELPHCVRQRVPRTNSIGTSIMNESQITALGHPTRDRRPLRSQSDCCVSNLVVHAGNGIPSLDVLRGSPYTVETSAQHCAAH